MPETRELLARGSAAAKTGREEDRSDDLLVPAGRSIPEDLLEKLLDFKTEALVPCLSDYLADSAAEIYQVPLENASLVARQRALQTGRRSVLNDSLHGERVRDFVMHSSGLIVDSYKLVLLPVWIGSCNFRLGKFPIPTRTSRNQRGLSRLRRGLQRH